MESFEPPVLLSVAPVVVQSPVPASGPVTAPPVVWAAAPVVPSLAPRTMSAHAVYSLLPQGVPAWSPLVLTLY